MSGPDSTPRHSRQHGRRRTPTGARHARREIEASEGDLAGLERLIFFSDAVFAIAITLLVIDIRLPDLGSSATASQVVTSLKNLGPHFFGFVVSFVVIGGFWATHHRTFRYVRRYDRAFIWINILFLMSVAFLPFSSSVISEYGNLPPAVVFYSVSLAITSLLFVVLWLYATYHWRLVDRTLSRSTIQQVLLQLSIPLVVFVASIPVATVTSHVEFLWLAIPMISRVMRRRTQTALA